MIFSRSEADGYAVSTEPFVNLSSKEDLTG